MRFSWFCSKWGWMMGTALAIAACSDDGVGSPQSTEGAATASPTGDGGDDADEADDGGSAGDGQATGGGPAGDSSGGLDAGTDAGTGGTAGEDATGGPPTEPECRDDRDCMVVNDCCTCEAVPVDEIPRECPKDCIQSSCDAMGLFAPAAECRVGLCVLAPKSCNPAEVSCDAPTPQCPDGTLPEVQGSCWSGECVPVQYCDVVPSCDACERHETCVVIETQVGPWYACEPVAPGCDGVPTCACMADICPETFDTCVDGEDGISCTCPQC